jgi:hypothetical protein
VAAADPQVTVERLTGLRAERARPRRPFFAHDHCDLVVHVEVRHREAGHLRQPHAGVEEQPDDRGVAPLAEARALHAGSNALSWSRDSTGSSGTFGACIPAIGSAGSSSSAVSHLLR